MSDATPDREAISAAKGLTGALEAVAGELKYLRNYGRTNRHLIVVTFASIALDLILTFFLVFTYSTAHDAGQVASAEHSSLIASCVAGNQTRAEQVQLWDHLAALSTPPPHETPAQKARGEQEIAMLLQYIRRVFKPRDCAVAYATSSPRK